MGYKIHYSSVTLDKLVVLNIDTLQGPRHFTWTVCLVERNRKTLRQLRIGNEQRLAQLYAFNRSDDLDSEASVFTGGLLDSLNRLLPDHKPSNATLSLESLILCGLDFRKLVQQSFMPPNDNLRINFDNLDALALESCIGLADAFPRLVGPEHARDNSSNPLRLRTFILRQERIDDNFMSALETFLLSIPPLTTLHVLLEGTQIMSVDVPEILKAHGQSLRSLIWDHRHQPGVGSTGITPFFQWPWDFEHLVDFCPKLRSVGFSLDWSRLTDGSRHFRERVGCLESSVRLS